MFPEGIRDVSCWPTFSTARKPHDPVGVRMRREGRACFEPRRTASRRVRRVPPRGCCWFRRFLAPVILKGSKNSKCHGCAEDLILQNRVYHLVKRSWKANGRFSGHIYSRNESLDPNPFARVGPDILHRGADPETLFHGRRAQILGEDTMVFAGFLQV